MNSLNLPNPKMMDVAVPANMKVGLAQDEIARRGWAVGADEALELVGAADVAFIDLREASERETPRRHPRLAARALSRSARQYRARRNAARARGGDGKRLLVLLRLRRALRHGGAGRAGRAACVAPATCKAASTPGRRPAGPLERPQRRRKRSSSSPARRMASGARQRGNCSTKAGWSARSMSPGPISNARSASWCAALHLIEGDIGERGDGEARRHRNDRALRAARRRRVQCRHHDPQADPATDHRRVAARARRQSHGRVPAGESRRAAAAPDARVPSCRSPRRAPQCPSRTPRPIRHPKAGLSR